MDAISLLVQQEGEIVGGSPIAEDVVETTAEGTLALITSNPLYVIGIIVVIIIIVYLLYKYLSS